MNAPTRPRLFGHLERPAALIVLGQCNSPGDTGMVVLYVKPERSPGAMLHQIARAGVHDASGEDLTARAWLSLTLRRNLCSVRWHEPEALDTARDVLALRQGRPLLLLGRRVSDVVYPALGHDFGAWRAANSQAGIYTIPNPTSRNRAYDRPEARAEAGKIVSEALQAALELATATYA